MRSAMEEDRTKHSILPLSKFGLMQITRQRVRPEMEINTREKCPTCLGTGEISPSILMVERIEQNLGDIVAREHLKSITVRLHPFIATYLQKGWLSSIARKWSRKHNCKIKITAVSSYDFLEFRFFNSEGVEIIH